MNRRDRYLREKRLRAERKGKFTFLCSFKNCIKIFRRDIASIVTNWVTLLIIIVLIVIPSLYAWFNIRACWDPYSNTKELSVAIVNLDNGGQYKDKKLNAGKDIVNKLKENDKIGWEFVNKDDAENGVKYGKYYASITIPKDFSKSLLSFVNDDIPEKAKLIYSVNEKKNAIAEKITDKGSSTLKEEITQTFIETVSDTIMSYLNDIGSELKNDKPAIKNIMQSIIDLDNQMPSIKSNLDNAYNSSIGLEQFIKSVQANVPTVSDSLSKAMSIAKENRDNLNKLQNSMEDLRNILKTNSSEFNKNNDSIKKFLQSAEEVSKINLNDSNQMLSSMNNIIKDNISKIDDSVKYLTDLENLLKQIKGFGNTTIDNSVDNVTEKNINIIKQLINNLSNMKNNMENEQNDINTYISSVSGEIANIQKEIPSDIQKAISNIDDASSKVTAMLNDINDKTIPALQNEIKNFNGISDNTITLLQNAQNTLPLINNSLSMADYGAVSWRDALGIAKDKFPTTQKYVHDVTERLRRLENDNKYDEIVDLLLKNSKDVSDFFSNPVDLQENRLFAIPNYGSAMSPFYTTLAIWVGTFVLLSLLTVHVKDFEDGTIFTSREEFFGRYFTIAIIAILQALVVTIGDMALLKTYVVSPIIFILIGIYVAIVFSMIIYMLVSVLGNIGKAITMVFMVLQVSASGGTYPIELTPPFFQYINPMLPFRYSIDAMREAVAGILWDSLMENLIMLAAFLFIALTIGVIFKPKANELLKRFVNQFKESGLAGD